MVAQSWHCQWWWGWWWCVLCVQHCSTSISTWCALAGEALGVKEEGETCQASLVRDGHRGTAPPNEAKRTAAEVVLHYTRHSVSHTAVQVSRREKKLLKKLSSSELTASRDWLARKDNGCCVLQQPLLTASLIHSFTLLRTGKDCWRRQKKTLTTSNWQLQLHSAALVTSWLFCLNLTYTPCFVIVYVTWWMLLICSSEERSFFSSSTDVRPASHLQLILCIFHFLPCHNQHCFIVDRWIFCSSKIQFFFVA